MPTETAVGYIRLSQDGMSLDAIYNEGKRASDFDINRPKYTALLDHIETSGEAVVVPNLSRLSRNRKERLRPPLTLIRQASMSTPSNSAEPGISAQAL